MKLFICEYTPYKALKHTPILLLEDLDPNITLYDLIIFLHTLDDCRSQNKNNIKEKPLFKSMNAFMYLYVKFERTDLASTLYDLFGGDGDKELLIYYHDFYEKIYDLSPEAIKLHKDVLTWAQTQLNSINYASVPDTNLNQTKQHKEDQLSTLTEVVPKNFPLVLTKLISEYSSEHDTYVVIEFNHPMLRLLNEWEISNPDYFFEVLESFFNSKSHNLVTIKEDLDGDISVSLNMKSELLHDPSKLGLRYTYFIDFDSAQTLYKTNDLLDDRQDTFSILFHLDKAYKISHIYSSLCWKSNGSCSDSPYFFGKSKKLFLINFSNLSGPNPEKFDAGFRVARYVLSEMNIANKGSRVENNFPTVLKSHSGERLAKYYFLAFHKPTTRLNRTPWSEANTLPEIISHALQSPKKNWFIHEKGTHTRNILLKMLGKNAEWFQKQTAKSIKQELVLYGQLYQASIRPILLTPINQEQEEEQKFPQSDALTFPLRIRGPKELLKTAVKNVLRDYQSKKMNEHSSLSDIEAGKLQAQIDKALDYKELKTLIIDFLKNDNPSSLFSFQFFKDTDSNSNCLVLKKAIVSSIQILKLADHDLTEAIAESSGNSCGSNVGVNSI